MMNTLGSWVTIGHPNVIEIMCNAGFDWLVLDMEHSPMSYETAQTLTAIIQGKGKKAYIRVAKNDDVLIKKALDIGIDGIIIPMISSRIEAEKAMSGIFYPPDGNRGVGLSRAQDFGMGFELYKNEHKNLKVIFQIESVEAIKNLREILSIPKLTGTIIGPYDLSGSIGKPGNYDDQEVQAMLKNYKRTSQEMKMPYGFHVISPDIELVQEKKKEGYTILAFSLDSLFLYEMIKQNLIRK